MDKLIFDAIDDFRYAAEFGDMPKKESVDMALFALYFMQKLYDIFSELEE